MFQIFIEMSKHESRSRRRRSSSKRSPSNSSSSDHRQSSNKKQCRHRSPLASSSGRERKISYKERRCHKRSKSPSSTDGRSHRSTSVSRKSRSPDQSKKIFNFEKHKSKLSRIFFRPEDLIKVRYFMAQFLN